MEVITLINIYKNVHKFGSSNLAFYKFE